MNFMFSWQELYLTRPLRSLVTQFLPLEHKIHIFSPPCNILYIWHSGHACFEFSRFRKQKKYAAYDRFHGNGPYGKILTRKGPIRTLGFTLPYNNSTYYTTQTVRGPITKINQSKCPIAGPIFSKYRTGHCPEWSRTCVFAVFAFFSRVINLLLTNLARDRTGRISALGLFCTDLAALGPYCQDLGKK